MQPACSHVNPSARKSVRKPACKSASSGLASYYIVKRYWKTSRQALRTRFQYSVLRCLQQATVGNSFNRNFPQFRAINSLLPIATARSVEQLLRIREVPCSNTVQQTAYRHYGLSSTPASKCRDMTSMTTLSLPSRYFTIHYSLIIPSFEATTSVTMSSLK